MLSKHCNCTPAGKELCIHLNRGGGVKVVVLVVFLKDSVRRFALLLCFLIEEKSEHYAVIKRYFRNVQ